MIHYTLLPEGEIRLLRKEYRFRLFVVALFFISISILIGVTSLIPSYIISRTEQNRILLEVNEMKKERESKGINQIDKDFSSTQSIINRMASMGSPTSFSDSVERIGAYRVNGISIHSFDMSYSLNNSTTTNVVIQGKAISREALVSFKKKLESDASFKNINLPISDLAKSKNIEFSLRMNIIK